MKTFNKAYKYRCYPTDKQIELLAKIFDHVSIGKFACGATTKRHGIFSGNWSAK